VSVLNFPIQGIDFKDVSTLLINNKVFRLVIKKLKKVASKYEFDVIVGPESRGF
jgi:adenine phosphoribosyltransferase